MKRIFGLLLVAILVLTACGGNNDKKVTIGVASSDTKAWGKVKELTKKDGIDLEIKHFHITTFLIKLLMMGTSI